VELAQTPHPPYYVAVITVKRTADAEGYDAAAEAMYDLARSQRGFLGMEWVSDRQARTGITASYWTDSSAIAEWRAHIDHIAIEHLGQQARPGHGFPGGTS
jgi:heme-degrading monooxygenase HmoA